MRILTIALAATVLLTACQVNSANKKEERKPLKLEAYLLNQIATTDSNWNKNEIFAERASQHLADTLPKLIDEGILDDFPLEMATVNEYRPGKFAARFDGAYHKGTFDMDNPIYNVQFDVIGLMDEATALSLKEDSFYTIEGKFKGFLQDDFQKYINGMANTWRVAYDKQTYSENTPQVSLGIILMDSIKVKRAEKPDGGHRYN